MTSAAPFQFLILLIASWIGRRQGEAIEYLRAENRVLRARLGHKRLRFGDSERRLLAQKGKPLGRKLLAEMASLATPETILRWYREQVAAKYDGSRTRGSLGRPTTRGDKIKQLLTMARENPSWGYTRLRGALENLGFDLGRSLLLAAGVQLLRLPVNSPNLNAHAERFVRSIKHECLRHIVPLGERHLRAVVRQFVEHYHAERNHQGLGNLIPFPSRHSGSPLGRIGRRERLGGVLSFYERSAA